MKDGTGQNVFVQQGSSVFKENAEDVLQILSITEEIAYVTQVSLETEMAAKSATSPVLNARELENTNAHPAWMSPILWIKTDTALENRHVLRVSTLMRRPVEHAHNIAKIVILRILVKLVLTVSKLRRSLLEEVRWLFVYKFVVMEGDLRTNVTMEILRTGMDALQVVRMSKDGLALEVRALEKISVLNWFLTVTLSSQEVLSYYLDELFTEWDYLWFLRSFKRVTVLSVANCCGWRLFHRALFLGFESSISLNRSSSFW